VRNENSEVIAIGTISFSRISCCPRKQSAPGVTRTPDRRIRNPLLYPAELRAQIATGNMSLCGEEKSSAEMKCRSVKASMIA
jgi:hypothetical protein